MSSRNDEFLIEFNDGAGLMDTHGWRGPFWLSR